MKLVLLIVFAAYPLLELAVLIRVGQIIGVAWTLAIVIGTAVLGLVTVRQQGFAVIGRMRLAVEAGAAPLVPAVEGALLVVAGTLLILPGLIGDVVGLLLLVPPIRRSLAVQWLGRSASGDATVSSPFRVIHRRREHGRERNHDRTGPGPVIEGEYSHVDDADADRRDR